MSEMSVPLEIRASGHQDAAALESLYPEAFPDEDLLPLVRDLASDAAVAVSLVGTIDTRIVGHAIFTRCGVVGNDLDAALLGPLAVAPAWQKRGIGRAIVRAGLRRLDEARVDRVFVLGDPAYYRRLGFRPESSVEPPFPLPAEWAGAWQSQSLRATARPCKGKLSVPRQWLRPALWGC